MNRIELKHRLYNDLKLIGLPVHEVSLGIRPFSKTYYGNYYPVYGEEGKMPRVYVYPWKDKQRKESYAYSFILDTAIHEMVHHLQHTDPNWVRYEGVMHDEQFWKLYNYYIFRAKILEVIESDYKTA